MGDTLKDIPEFFETDMGECVTTRTLSLSSCRELGPPDLCHVIKTNSKPGVKELGCYHFVSGLESSSSATMAAYLTSLTYLMDVPQGWFAKAPLWRVRSGIYCCYNAFSRVDIRVEVKIPGGVDSYAVNSKAEKHPIKDEYWVETYISAVLRSMLYSDDLNYKTDGLRSFNIIPDLDAEMRFFEAVEKIFWKGHLLGAEADLQFPTNVNNYLTDGIMKYLHNTGRYHSGINLFMKLAEVDPEINSLLAKCYFDTDQEILGVQALYNGLQVRPSSYSLLLAQTEFLERKDRLDLAIILARRAVNVAPSEFRSWIKLAEIYVDLKDYKSALLTLNSCPMFALTERELPKMPTPQRIHLPPKPESILAYGLEEEPEQEGEQTSPLSRLPGNSLKGTFAKAYSLLTLIASKIGWDELLHYRSSSFVMEEEYRMQKTKEEKTSSTRNIASSTKSASLKSPEPKANAEEGGVPNLTSGNLDSSSTEATPTAIEVESKSTLEEADKQPPEVISMKEEEPEGQVNESEDINDSPTVNIDDGFNEVELTPELNEGKSENEEKNLGEAMSNLDLEEKSLKEDVELDNNDTSNKSDTEPSSIQSIKTSPKENRSGLTTPISRTSVLSDPQSNKFSHKRLCERWLDNLFMVLYEDLRAFTSWRAEMSGTRSQRLTYRYSGKEWESLGDLCLRLHRNDEAQDAYTNCVHLIFSSRSWAFLLEQHTKENELQLIMGAMIRLAMYFEKQYSVCQIPSPIMLSMKQIIESHGLAKIQNLLLSLDLAPEVLKVINSYIDIAKTFRMKGTEEA